MTRRVHPARAVGAFLALCGLAACESDRGTVFEPVDPPVFDFVVGPSGTKLPSGTTAGQSLLFLSSTTSDLGGGADFNLRLVPRTRTPGNWMAPPEAEVELNVVVAAGATESSFAFTDAGNPGRDGFAGTHQAVFNVTAHTEDSLVHARVVLARVDAAGAVQTASAPSSEVRIGAPGPRTFTFNNLNLGPWNPGDRMRVEFRFRNIDATLADSITIATARQAVTRPTRALTMTASSLASLGSGSYHFWLLGRDNSGLDVATPAYGSLWAFFTEFVILPNGDTLKDAIGNPVLAIDSTVVSATPVNTYAGSSDSTVSWLRMVIDSAGDGGTPVQYHAVVVSRESGAATEPGPVQFLWHRTGLHRTDTTATMLFGTFGGSDLINIVSPNDYVYTVLGAGNAGARGAELSVDLTELSRPPVGFYYAGYVVDTDGIGVLVDTLRSAWSADSSISRLSLYNADVNDLLAGVVGNEIRNAQIRNCASGSGIYACQSTMQLPATNTFAGLSGFQIKLEPKGSTSITNALVSFTGALPDEVK